MWHLIILCCFQADVDRLRHPDFAVRQAAEERLTVWRDLTWPLLDRPFSDVEQRRRARRIVQATFGSNPAPLPFLAQHCYLEWYHERENGNSYPRIQAGRPLHDSQLLFLQITRKGWLDRLLDHYCVQAKEYPEEWVSPRWYRLSDCCTASAHLVRDLRRLGVPPLLIRRLVACVGERYEAALRVRSLP